jgi:nitrite reductase/ring-hydroxylating ferredoxin subunit
LTLEENGRREFCTQACRGVAVAAFGGVLGSILEGCGGSGSTTGPSSFSRLPVIDATVANGSVAVTIDSSSPLAAVGSAALIQTPSGDLLVAHTAQDSYLALSANCTHQACIISGYANQTFVCPCHGSQFSTSGKVLSGPAPSPLAHFTTQFSNNVLTIS